MLCILSCGWRSYEKPDDVASETPRSFSFQVLRLPHFFRGGVFCEQGFAAVSTALVPQSKKLIASYFLNGIASGPLDHCCWLLSRLDVVRSRRQPSVEPAFIVSAVAHACMYISRRFDKKIVACAKKTLHDARTSTPRHYWLLAARPRHVT